MRTETKEMEKTLDSQLWHACAGGMVQMPPVNSMVFYFPQGHAEHAQATVDLGGSSRIPGLILCKVVVIKFLADPETDEVYAKLRLLPVGENEAGGGYGDDAVFGSSNGSESADKPASFAKTLTQSDANNGGGFSVPRYCAETIFPRLDYTADPPVQTVMAKDVHGEVWKFRHIYRGTPRRHLLTTGWSSFVNQKKLIAGDSIVFLRSENGDLCVGIRRAKRGIFCGGPDSNNSSGGWNPTSGNSISPFGGFSMYSREDENNKLIMRNGYGGMNLNSDSSNVSRGNRKLRPESVIEAASLAANGQSFEVVYYPRASTPEFCVKASSVNTAMRIQWCSGMRFKMPFETEDSSRISWFMGTIASVQVADSIRWPNSPWRLLQVTWDEPDLLQNVKRVSPWLVELVANMPVIHLSPFSTPRKKVRVPQHPDFPLDGQFPLPPSFTGNPLGSSSASCAAGIQGARHAQIGISLSDLHFHHNNFPQPGLFASSGSHRFDPRSRFTDRLMMEPTKSNDNISCLLTMGISNSNLEKTEIKKAPHFLLFGQPILTEQEITCSSSSDTVSQVLSGKCSSEENQEKGSAAFLGQKRPAENSVNASFLWQGMESTGHCMVFMESEDVGRAIDISALGSYEELYRTLAQMFGLEKLDRLSHVLYQDVTGALKRVGDEPFR